MRDGALRGTVRTPERFIKDDIHIKFTEMKRITLLLMAAALWTGTAASAQDLRREERTMKRYEQRAENDMRRTMRRAHAAEVRAENHARQEMMRAGSDMRQEMRRAGKHMHPMQQPNCQAVKVVSYQSTMVGETVDMDFMINYDGVMLDANEEFVITPYLSKGENMLWLAPVVITGEKRYRDMERGMGLSDNPSGLMPYETVVLSRPYVREMRREARRNGMQWTEDSPNTVMYSASFPYQAWMDGADIKLDHVYSNSRRNIVAEYPTTIGTLYNPMPPQVMFLVPEVEVVKARTETMTSRIVFQVNKTTVDMNIFDNAAELENIYKFTGRLAGDDKIKVTGIEMTGYASPEGPYNLNAKLSLGRVNAIRDLVQKRFPRIEKSLYDVNNVPEDWDSVRRWVAASDIRYRNEVLDIIDNYAPDARDAKIRALDRGATYNMLLHDVYPGLRRTDYTIDYTVLPFTVEEGKKVIATHPQYLSLNEFYQIALSYPQDSPQYEEVFVTALRYFPDDPVANNNMAAIALRKNDLKEAHKYLDKLGDFAGAHNNIGVLKALEGDYRAAEAHFRKAIEHGSKEAKFNLDNLTSLRRH